MPALAVLALWGAAQHLSIPKAISGITGSISMAAWICVILPQMVVNYRKQSADALSMAFLVVWMLGDTTNLIGGLMTHLAPTAIALAMYFCVADALLISQCYYYNSVNARRAAEIAQSGATETSETAPLLARRRSSTHSTHQHATTEAGSSAAPVGKVVGQEDETSDANSWTFNILSVLAVYAAGFAGWFLSYKAGAWDVSEPTPDAVAPIDPQQGQDDTWESIGLALGYASALCYICARVPQIYKNYKEKSCEGLAVLFFMLSLTGNLTYAISLMAYSQDRKYLINAIPWLIGSLGTVVEDGIIFIQFRLYANNKRATITDA